MVTDGIPFRHHGVEGAYEWVLNIGEGQTDAAHGRVISDQTQRIGYPHTLICST